MKKQQIGRATLYLADCEDALKEIEAETIDAVVVDPPYGLSFMGKGWDHAVPSPDVWRLVRETMKPGAHLLSFFGSRTYHRGTVSIEDAGFEIRDQIMWLHGQGMPKSLNVSKAIDKAAGATREIIGSRPLTGNARVLKGGNFDGGYEGREITATYDQTAPATPEAELWDGWGTALKPAHEPVTLARKPFSGTVAANVLARGTGALNIDVSRVGTGTGERAPDYVPNNRNAVYGSGMGGGAWDASKGRFPANVLHDGCDEVIAAFPITSPSPGSTVRSTTDSGRASQCPGHKAGEFKLGFADGGSAARFFYCAKASRKDRGEGNIHPTVKPNALMAYLCRLVTPPAGVVLDPFMGSGSTGVAALQEGFGFIGIERDPAYFEIACQRIAAAQGIELN